MSEELPDGWCYEHKMEIVSYEVMIPFVVYQGRRYKGLEYYKLSCGCMSLYPEINLVDETEEWLRYEVVDGIHMTRVMTWREPKADYE